jgi:hypothetical protein
MTSPDLRYWTTKAYSATVVDICYRVGGGVVSPRRVQGWKALTFSRPFRTGAWCGCLSVCWSYSEWASFSACVLSPCMYLAVYYLCRLQMSMSSLCPSPATNIYDCLFPSLPNLWNLGSEGAEGWGPWFAAYDTHSMARHRLSTWSFLYHDVDSLSQIKKICGEQRQSIKNLRSFWWIIYMGIVVSRRNARATDKWDFKGWCVSLRWILSNEM